MWMFISQVPSLIGIKQRDENRLITLQKIANETGLSRATVSKWVKPDEEIGYLDPDTAFRLCEYFQCTLNDLVKIVKKEQSHE